MEVAQRIGYRRNAAARAMKTGRSGTLALVLPDLTNPFFPSLAQAVFRMARDLGYGMFLVDTEGSEPLETSSLAMLAGLGVEGVVWFPIRDKDTSQGALSDIPTVVLDRTVPGYDMVGIDYVEAGRIAAQHLLDAGHRRIGIISGPTDIAAMRDRCAGAEQLIRAEGELVFEVANAFSVDLEPQARAALDTGTATAVFAAADVIALGAIRHVLASGRRVPEDMSILGFDDIPWADQSLPPLSTVELPVEEIAPHAVELLVDRLDAKRPAARETILVQTRAIPRATVGRPGGP